MRPVRQPCRMVAGAACPVGQQFQSRQPGLRRGIAMAAVAFQLAHRARPGHRVQRRRRKGVRGTCTVIVPGRAGMHGEIARHVTVARHARVAQGDDDVALAAGLLRIRPRIHDRQAVVDGGRRRGRRRHGAGLPALQIAQRFVQQFSQRRRPRIRAGTLRIAAAQAIDVSGHPAAMCRQDAIGGTPFGIGILLRQEGGCQPALPAHVRQRGAQHAAIHGSVAGRRGVQVAKHAHAHPAAMALDGAHGLVILAIRQAQIVAQRALPGIAHPHARQEHAMRAGGSGSVATAAQGQAGVAKQQAITTGNDGQLRQAERRRGRHALAQHLARKMDGMREEIRAGGTVRQVCALQHRLAHLIDDTLAPRQGIADDIEHAGAGPVQKVAAETVAAAAMQRIGPLQDGEVSGRYPQVRHSDAILAAVGVAVAHAGMKVAGILALRRIIAAMGRSGGRMRERQVEQQARWHSRPRQAHVGTRQIHRGRGGEDDAAAQASQQRQPGAASAPPDARPRRHGTAPAACLR